MDGFQYVVLKVWKNFITSSEIRIFLVFLIIGKRLSEDGNNEAMLEKSAGFYLNDLTEWEPCYIISFVVQRHSSIAQSVEHAAVNRAVVGSSPTRGAFLCQFLIEAN